MRMARRSSFIRDRMTISLTQPEIPGAASRAALSRSSNRPRMHIREFALERFFAEHEFAAKHILGASDVEGMPMADLLHLADDEARRMWSGLHLGYTESLGLP